MKFALVILLLCAAVSAQRFRPGFRPGFRPFRRPSFQQPQRGFQRQQSNFIQGSGAPIDRRLGNSAYHYSWRHAGFHTKWAWGGANAYCRSLPGNWLPVSINSAQENNLVSSAIGAENVSYIWTGGQRSGNGFRWLSGPFNYQNWSRTGGAGIPQPDNRERRNENCLAVLNNFYRDGIVWHDVGCHHEKPVICESSG